MDLLIHLMLVSVWYIYVSGFVLGHKEIVVRGADTAPVFTKLIAYLLGEGRQKDIRK